MAWLPGTLTPKGKGAAGDKLLPRSAPRKRCSLFGRQQDGLGSFLEVPKALMLQDVESTRQEGTMVLTGQRRTKQLPDLRCSEHFRVRFQQQPLYLCHDEMAVSMGTNRQWPRHKISRQCAF